MARAFSFTILALLAFAANSLLCRMALAAGLIGPAAFTLVRLGAGAAVLLALGALENKASRPWQGGNATSALALLGYAALFSYAYISLDTGTGALILFAAVQMTMIAGGLLTGRRLAPPQWLGACVAMAGLAYFLAPGAAAPDALGATLMAASGVCWGLYSLRQRRAGTALSATGGNFLIAAMLAAPALALASDWSGATWTGIGLAALSGAVTSGIGYAIWYQALALIQPAVAATAQLSVPLLAAGAGIAFLDESLSWRFAIAAALVVGGIVLVLRGGGGANATAKA
ncbi:MAG: DMT family transporter [Sphingomonadales bacterium]